jgi:hypothetical protein
MKRIIRKDPMKALNIFKLPSIEPSSIIGHRPPTIEGEEWLFFSVHGVAKTEQLAAFLVT